MSDLAKISVIIPTKDRPDDLLAAVRSLLNQTITPAQLIVVDQSTSETGRRKIEQEVSLAVEERKHSLVLYYLLDPAVVGASAARNRGMRIADGNIWLFLDDDVVLEPTFIGELVKSYSDYPNASGISGIITNYPPMPAPYRLWSGLFVHGPFHDERYRIYCRADRLRTSPPIRVRHFTGCAMSFRADAIRHLQFDQGLDQHFRGVSDGEDVAICHKMGSAAELLIAPRARLRHNHSRVGRLTDHWLRRHARANVFLYKTFWDGTFANRLSYCALRVGYCLVALLASARRLSLKPWQALAVGLGEAQGAFCARNHQVHSVPQPGVTVGARSQVISSRQSESDQPKSLPS